VTTDRNQKHLDPIFVYIMLFGINLIWDSPSTSEARPKSARYHKLLTTNRWKNERFRETLTQHTTLVSTTSQQRCIFDARRAPGQMRGRINLKYLSHIYTTITLLRVRGRSNRVYIYI